MPLRTLAPLLLLVTVLAPLVIGAQDRGDTQRVSDRIRALQREAERLAGESRTLVGDLRQREIDRQIKAEQLKQAEATMAEAERALQETTTRLADLELQRINQLPDVKAQLVDIYKGGRSGYARLLFSARDFRELARATRAVGALSAINERRVEEHRRTIEATRQERMAFEQKAKELQAKAADARRAKSASDSAVASAAELIRQIDSRRDLTAQYVGELQVAYTRLQQQVTALSTDKPSPEPVAVPLQPFQGALEWPVQGRMAGKFGEPSSRLGGRSETVSKSPLKKTHRSGRFMAEPLGYAGPSPASEPWSSSTTATMATRCMAYPGVHRSPAGQCREAGAEVGRVGLAPAGPPTLYLEMRIDGRSVNPVQWLEATLGTEVRLKPGTTGRRDVRKGRSRVMTSRTRLWILAVSDSLSSRSPSLAVTSARPADATTRYQHLRVFDDVVSHVVNNYVEEVNIQQAMRGAMRGLSDALDPDSAYLTPELVKGLSNRTRVLVRRTSAWS